MKHSGGASGSAVFLVAFDILVDQPLDMIARTPPAIETLLDGFCVLKMWPDTNFAQQHL